MKIELKKRLWNTEKGEVIDVPKEKAEFALRKGYATKVVVKRSTKEVKPKENKNEQI
jgi:hypothetical protein